MNTAEIERMRVLEERHFWFRARRRGLRPWLAGALARAPQGPVLDLGAGTGSNLGLLTELAGDRRVLGIDSSPVALSHCQVASHGTDLLRADALEPPFQDSTLAVITALDVLEHLKDDDLALAQISRCLLPGGELIATVPAHPALFGNHDRALGHHKRYERNELDRKLEAQGLEIIDSRPFNTLLLPAVSFWRRARRGFQEGELLTSDVRQLPRILNEFLGTIMALDQSLPRNWTEFSGLSWWVHARLRT